MLEKHLQALDFVEGFLHQAMHSQGIAAEADGKVTAHVTCSTRNCLVTMMFQSE